MTSLHGALPEHAARRCQQPLNTFHATVYFSPEIAREMGALGIEDFSAVNIAARSAAFGRVGPGPVTAAFYNYKHELIARHLPAVWDVAAPQDVLAARLRAVDGTLRRLLGEDAVASPEMAEAAELALRAAEGCGRGGRPLHSAHADLPVPEAPHLALWHAATLLREHRGDGHVLALVRAGLDPVEALLSHSATGGGMSDKWLMRTRSWTVDELNAGRERLRARGLLDAAGALTEAGAALREELEEETDRLDAAPYEHLGAAGVARLTELGKTFAAAVVAAGAFPADLLGNG
ncbi:SCO6745 family protein [Streptomyces sp. URMC 127]|uniref:SCO6745 family protein n=1 Tax=Streptomyces sp. URMC 127 TaxID=3423402 RepID=UPI003F19C9E8